VKVFSFHRLANSFGQIAGPLAAGVLAALLGWRAPFLLLAIPTVLVIVFARRLREPVRGEMERLAAGFDSVTAAVAEERASFRESMRTLARVPTLRRIWLAVPFLAVSLFGITNLVNLVYEDVYKVSEVNRGLIAAAVEPAQLIGVFVMMPLASRLVLRSPALVMRFIAVVGLLNGVFLAVFAFAPNLGVAIAMHLLVSATIGILAPALFAALSLVLPPKARSLGFSVLTLFAVPGIIIVLPTLGSIADRFGHRISMLALIPIAIIGAFVLASAQSTIVDDIEKVRSQSATLVSPRSLVAD
jgi:branched-chain amino acid transport system ATP-binding protein